MLTVNGQTVTARNVSHNGTLAPGGSGTFGFQVSRPNGNTQMRERLCLRLALKGRRAIIRRRVALTTLPAFLISYECMVDTAN